MRRSCAIAILFSALACAALTPARAGEGALAQLRGTHADETGATGALRGTEDETAATPQLPTRAEAALAGERTVLNQADVRRYEEIFQLQESAQWSRADAIIKDLDNPILVGHILADRYLHPTAYRSKYTELARWLDSYADLPQADKIYTLALKRRPSSSSWPKRPDRVSDRGPRYEPETQVPSRGSASERRQVAQVQRQVRTYLNREMPTKALELIESSKNAKFLTRVEADEMRSWIAAGYYFEHVDEKAYELAHMVAERRRDEVPLADWTAGLAAWRIGKIETAAHHFEALANAPQASSWNRSAGGYWAARAHLVAGTPERVSTNLRIAASEPSTFYGLLAMRQLGQDPGFAWDLPAASSDDYARALAIPAVRRAIALAQIGEHDRADQEMRRGHAVASLALDAALVSLCAQYELAASQLHVAEASSRSDLSGALYPVPPYRPQNGFTVDPALLYAFMRQESRFKAQAKSGAGAAGLMQIMPATAAHVARDRSLKSSNRARLYDPAYNLKLAQDYIEELLGTVEPRGNLFMVLAAYNGGPGNLRRWMNEMERNDDPLLFIESLPSRETRVYIERVLTNLWMYRYRLGEDMTSLDQVAAGEWPFYEAASRTSAAGTGAGRQLAADQQP